MVRGRNKTVNIDKDYIEKQTNCEYCFHCGRKFTYCQEDVKWYDKGLGYSEKYLICPECGAYIVLKCIEDNSLNLNYDLNYYN